MTELHIDTSLQLGQYHHLYVGLSGGLDSTVLLHRLTSIEALKGKITAVHIQHGLSPYASIWQTHCQAICNELQIPCILQSVEFDRRSNIEEGARLARYAVFASLLGGNDALLLAHHANDQAETFLLQLMRGAGIDGLAAMPLLKKFGKGVMIRPFLTIPRETLKAYALLNQLNWIEDESNQNQHFSRNFIRHQVIPLLEDKWPSAIKNITRSVFHNQQALENLDRLAALDCGALQETSSFLEMDAIRTKPVSEISNILRVWLKKNQVRMPSAMTLQRVVHEIIFSSKRESICVAWGNRSIQSYQGILYLVEKRIPQTSPISWLSFPNDLVLPHTSLRAIPASEGLYVPKNCQIEVRFREEKETLRLHGQTKSLKKLFQAWRILPWQRQSVPLIYLDGQLAAVVGYAIDDRYFSKQGNCIYLVHELSKIF